MTGSDYRILLGSLVKKNPRPESIATARQAAAFKELVVKAQKSDRKSEPQLHQIYNQLKAYY